MTGSKKKPNRKKRRGTTGDAGSTLPIKLSRRERKQIKEAIRRAAPDNGNVRAYRRTTASAQALCSQQALNPDFHEEIS